MSTCFPSCLCFLLFLPCHATVGQDKPLPKLNTSLSVITFDPANCEIGSRGSVHTGCQGVAIVIIARKDGNCIFDYNTDACGGVLTSYRCKVPLNGGVVTISNENGGIKNSFSDKCMSLVSSSGPGGLTRQIGDTGEYLQIKHHDQRSEMFPTKGATVKYRFHFYTNDQFKDDLPGAFFDPTQEFVLGSPDVWPWLQTATVEMAVGDRLLVVVPARCAKAVEPWLKDARKAENYFVAVTLINMKPSK